MMRYHQYHVRPEDIRSEKYMCELFGMSLRVFREFAAENNFHVAKISNKTRLYDMDDVVRLFEQKQS